MTTNRWGPRTAAENTRWIYPAEQTIKFQRRTQSVTFAILSIVAPDVRDQTGTKAEEIDRELGPSGRLEGSDREYDT